MPFVAVAFVVMAIALGMSIKQDPDFSLLTLSQTWEREQELELLNSHSLALISLNSRTKPFTKDKTSAIEKSKLTYQ